jgi:hypothetical protein
MRHFFRLVVCVAIVSGPGGCVSSTAPVSMSEDQALSCGPMTGVPRTAMLPIDSELLASAAGGAPGPAVEASAFDSTGPASDRPPQVVYLNRDLCRYTAGADDSAHGSSSVVSAEHLDAAMLPAFNGSDAAFSSITTCIAAQFRRFNLRITAKRPSTGPYIEAHFGGDGSELGLQLGTGGIAPIDRGSCSVLDRAVVYVFTGIYGDNLQAICEAGAQEIAHALSLDHEYLCQDPMSYVQGCGKKAFQDKDAPCGETEPRACICGRATQNSVEVLAQKVGWAARAEVPQAATEAATERPSDVDPISVTVGSNEVRVSGVASAYATDSAVTLGIEVVSEGDARAPLFSWRSPSGTEQPLGLCPQGSGRSSISVRLGAVIGDRALVIRAGGDGAAGDEGPAAMVPVHVE